MAIIGSGSLAQAACRSLAAADPAAFEAGLDVVLIARNASAGRAACTVAGSLAALAGRPVRFSYAAADLGDVAGLTEVLESVDPLGVLLCASYQSPWERLQAPSGWTALLARAGFGLMLPLQAAPAVGVGEAIARACPGAWLVNACFPDAVNPLLAQLGIPVTCGAGNVAMLAAALASGLGIAEPSRLKVVAHHLHLHAPQGEEEEARAWVDDQPLEGVTSMLAGLRATPRSSLVDVAGASAAHVVTALINGHRLDAQVPGPFGLPGGYPVRFEAGTLALRLPEGLTEADAVAFNQRAAWHDGVVVTGGQVAFSPAVSRELARELPGLADGFAVTDIASACDRLAELRARLRHEPKPEVGQ